MHRIWSRGTERHGARQGSGSCHSPVVPDTKRRPLVPETERASVILVRGAAPGMGPYSTRSARLIPNVAAEPPAEIVRGSVLVSSDTK